MPTIGILLPGSTLYPSIGIDLMQGLRSCLKLYGKEDVSLEVATIGFGVKDEEVYAAAEKMLLVHNAAVVILFAGDHHAMKLDALFSAAGKLLIISNAGASYPQVFDPLPKHTIFHSLNDCLCCYLTGKYAAGEPGGNAGIMATSFFDGGYNHTHAMSNAFAAGGGEIRHNFVSHFKKDEFNTDNLVAFAREHPDVKKMLAVFSGDMARIFFEQVKGLEDANLQWYCSPMMFDETPGDFAEPKPMLPAALQGYTNWVPGIANEANQGFMSFYKNEQGKPANIFSLQGWETGLLLIQYLQLRNESSETIIAMEALNGKTMNSPRGTVRMHNGHLIAPAYLVKATGKLELLVVSCIEETLPAWTAMQAQIPNEPFSSWRNTYLCI